MNDFLGTFNLSVQGVIAYLPALVGGIATFVLTLVIANLISRWVSKFAMRRTKDSLVANFTGKIIWTLIFILGMVLMLGILGLGTISNKILAAAGITTFVVGFALKDIGENFLAGLILAFGRPYRVGNTIECSGITGRVTDMTLRQTTVETDNGKVVLIPNSMILKNPLSILKTSDVMSEQFFLNVGAADAGKALELVKQTIDETPAVLNNAEKATRVEVVELAGDQLKVNAAFWINNQKLEGSRSQLKSAVMLKVFGELEKAGYKYSG